MDSIYTDNYPLFLHFPKNIKKQNIFMESSSFYVKCIMDFFKDSFFFILRYFWQQKLGMSYLL